MHIPIPLVEAIRTERWHSERSLTRALAEDVPQRLAERNRLEQATLSLERAKGEECVGVLFNFCCVRPQLQIVKANLTMRLACSDSVTRSSSLG